MAITQRAVPLTSNLPATARQADADVSAFLMRRHHRISQEETQDDPALLADRGPAQAGFPSQRDTILAQRERADLLVALGHYQTFRASILRMAPTELVDEILAPTDLASAAELRAETDRVKSATTALSIRLRDLQDRGR